jgi:hypothetical protein
VTAKKVRDAHDGTFRELAVCWKCEPRRPCKTQSARNDALSGAVQPS